MERCPPLTVRCLLQVGLLLRWPFGEQKPCLPGEESSVPPGFVWDGCHHQQTPISAEKLGGMCRGRLGSAEMRLRHWDRIVGIGKRLRGADECGYKELWLSV